jgi:NAD(P)-dependent dehydrogenase (short-subunit alcohol dehydrogenase family)
MRKAVVITGSTRGMGFALADAFLGFGCQVVISGRTKEGVGEAVDHLCLQHPDDNIFGKPCDVRDYSQVEDLWEAARAHFGRVDIWINNAGISHPQANFWEHSTQMIDAVVGTNVIGSMYGTRVALLGMLEQGYGALYNMEGLGSDGRIIEGLALYGSTKSALHYLDRALIKQLAGTPVIVGVLSPGMLVTDMLTAQYRDRPVEEWERAKKVFNILADRVENVAPWMAEQILKNEKSGVYIKWLTQGRLIRRFLLAPFHKRDLFSDSY